MKERFNRLSLKLSLAVAAFVVTGALGLRSLGLMDVLAGWSLAALALAVGAATYAVTHRLLVHRLLLARSTLRQIRRHQFEDLEAARLPRGDEMSDLIWQVYRTGQTLEKEIRELKKMENYRREFIGNVSHELKTPIFAIQGFSETLLDGALEDARVRESFVNKILRNADRLNHLARDLAEIARIETGQLQMTPEPFDLIQLVREVNESLEMAAEAKSIELANRIPKELPPILGDRERIRQVITNLVDNALKYNGAGGNVEVVARRLPEGPIKISVVDDGIGIAPEHIARLTERFYRVDQSRSRDQGGTGLGLAIVKHILQAHESRLLVESNPQRGSTFGFTLPSASAPERGSSADGPASQTKPTETAAREENRQRGGARPAREVTAPNAPRAANESAREAMQT